MFLFPSKILQTPPPSTPPSLTDVHNHALFSSAETNFLDFFFSSRRGCGGWWGWMDLLSIFPQSYAVIFYEAQGVSCEKYSLVLLLGRLTTRTSSQWYYDYFFSGGYSTTTQHNPDFLHGEI